MPPHISGHPDTAKKWQSLYLVNRGYERTDITPDEIEVSGIKVNVYPDGTKVYPFPDGGIDPYEFPRFNKVIVRVCKVIVTVLVLFADYTEDTEDAEGCFGNFEVFSQSSGAL